MNQLRWLALAVVSCVFLGSIAVGQDKTDAKTKKGKDVDQAVEAVLKRLDTNKDGKISRDEAKGKPLEKAFDVLDKNKDGYLDRNELRPWAERIGNTGQFLKTAKGFPESITDSRRPDFDALDKDADGRLTREELAGTPWAEVFDKIDANKDGRIDRKEFEAYFKQLNQDTAKTEPAKTAKDKNNKK
jgi:Ca2+-binding EF-hand superfamily protein